MIWSVFFISTHKKKVAFPSTRKLRLEHLWQLLLKVCCAFIEGQSVVIHAPPRPPLFSRQLHDVQAVARQGHWKGALCF